MERKVFDSMPIAPNGLVFGVFDTEMLDLMNNVHNWKARAAVLDDMNEVLQDD